MPDNLLYRALRNEEVEAGIVLIPKGQGPFAVDPRLDIDTRLPFVLGPTDEHAVRQHQWQQDGFPTKGISTTPHFERACIYAESNRIIVVIDRRLFDEYGIREYHVNTVLGTFPEDIAVPEDDEVIIVYDNDGTLPREIIVDIINLDEYQQNN